MSRQTRERAVQVTRGWTFTRLEASYHRLLEEHDRLASRVTILQVAIRQLSRASGRHLARYAEQKRRADLLQATVDAAVSRPARLARLIMRCERVLYRLGYPRCPSCGLLATDHRYNCRVASLIAAIQHELPIDS